MALCVFENVLNGCIHVQERQESAEGPGWKLTEMQCIDRTPLPSAAAPCLSLTRRVIEHANRHLVTSSLGDEDLVTAHALLGRLIARLRPAAATPDPPRSAVKDEQNGRGQKDAEAVVKDISEAAYRATEEAAEAFLTARLEDSCHRIVGPRFGRPMVFNKRNASLDIRPEPRITSAPVSSWNNSTIHPYYNRLLKV